MIEISRVTKRYGATTAVEDVSFTASQEGSPVSWGPMARASPRRYAS